MPYPVGHFLRGCTNLVWYNKATFVIWALTVIWQHGIKFWFNYVIFQNYGILEIKWLSQAWHNGRDLHVFIFQKTTRRPLPAAFLMHMFLVFILAPSPQAISILFSKLSSTSIQSHSIPYIQIVFVVQPLHKKFFFVLKYNKIRK